MTTTDSKLAVPGFSRAEPSHSRGTRASAPGRRESPRPRHGGGRSGQEKPRPRNQHSPMPWGKRQEHNGGHRFSPPAAIGSPRYRRPAPKLGVGDDRTTKGSPATSSAVGRRLRFDPPGRSRRFNWPHLHRSMPIAGPDGGYLRLSHSANRGSSRNGVPSSLRWT